MPAPFGTVIVRIQPFLPLSRSVSDYIRTSHSYMKGSPNKYWGDILLRWSTGVKSSGMAQGRVWNECGKWNPDHAAWLLPAARDGSCLNSCNGHLALRPSEQMEWQERRRSRLPVVWREQDVNKKQRFLSSFQIGKGISCRQLVAPALEYILRWRMNIYCDGGWIYTAMADEYILRWQMNIYCDVGWIYIRLFQSGNLFIYSELHKFWK